MASIQVPDDLLRSMQLVFSDKRNILWPVANLNLEQIDLTAARTKQLYDLPGDFLYADSDSTGKAFIRINNPSMLPMPFKVNSGIRGFPLNKIYLTNAAQPGLMLNLWWGYGADIIPPNQDITTIGSITNPVDISDRIARLLGVVQGVRSQASAMSGIDQPVLTRDLGYKYGASVNNVGVAAATAVALFAPGSNTGGATVWSNFLVSNMAAQGVITVLAKASAPGNIQDGDALDGLQIVAANSPVNPSRAARSHYIDTGKGVYWFSNTAETGGIKSATYTLW